MEEEESPLVDSKGWIPPATCTVLERSRPVRTPFPDATIINFEFDSLEPLLNCAICLCLLEKTCTVMECLHRFCAECFEKALRLTKRKDCPKCRVHLSSRRSGRLDVKFDKLVELCCPEDREVLIQKEMESVKELLQSKSHQSFVNSMLLASAKQSSKRGQVSDAPKLKRKPRQTYVLLQCRKNNSFMGSLLPFLNLDSFTLVVPLHTSMRILSKYILLQLQIPVEKNLVNLKNMWSRFRIDSNLGRLKEGNCSVDCVFEFYHSRSETPLKITDTIGPFPEEVVKHVHDITELSFSPLKMCVIEFQFHSNLFKSIKS